MDPSPIKNIARQPCGCTLTEYMSGRRTFAPCIPCGLMRAGHALAEAAVCSAWQFRRLRAALLEAGNALAAVATTINTAADELQQKQQMDAAIRAKLEDA